MLQISRQIDKCNFINHITSQGSLQDGMVLMGLVALVLVYTSYEAKILLLVSSGKMMLTPAISSDQSI